jgi:hypothetical protein
MQRTMECEGDEGLGGSGLLVDNNHTSYMCQCIMIAWVKTLSTPPFID